MAKKKAKKAPKKSKAKRAVGTKAKKTAKRKVKASPRKTVTKKKSKSPVNKKSKRGATLKTRKSARAKRKPAVAETPVIEKITRGEDLHLIPRAGEVHPVGIDEAKRVEHFYRQHDDVAFRQELQKVKESLATRKGSKPIYRNRGRGS